MQNQICLAAQASSLPTNLSWCSQLLPFLVQQDNPRLLQGSSTSGNQSRGRACTTTWSEVGGWKPPPQPDRPECYFFAHHWPTCIACGVTVARFRSGQHTTSPRPYLLPRHPRSLQIFIGIATVSMQAAPLCLRAMACKSLEFTLHILKQQPGQTYFGKMAFESLDTAWELRIAVSKH